MGKLYTLDQKLLVGSPEIRIGDKLFPVDDRTSTVKKMTKLSNAGNRTDSDDEILKLAFVEKAYKEIKAMDLPFAAYLEVVKLTVAAMTGEEPEQVEERFQETKQDGK